MAKKRDVKSIMSRVKQAKEKEGASPKSVATPEGKVEAGQDTRKISDLKFVKRNRKADKKTVEWYADTIKKAGLLVPVVVSEDNEILDGERRARACKSLGWTEVPVVVTKKDFDSVSVITNFLRMNYSPEQVLERMEYMKDELGMTQAKIALACGISQGRVSQIFKDSDEKKSKKKKKSEGTPGKIPSSKLPHKVSVRVRKLTVDVTFKLDEGDMKNPGKAISDLFSEIKQFDAMVKNARAEL